MKKLFWILGVAAMACLAVVSCKKDNEKEKEPVDVNDITEDGFYVMGDATGIAKVTDVLAMAKGINEAKDQSLRDGMFEKYIVLQGGKDFTLAYVEGGKQTNYGANLAEFKPAELTGIYDSNPADKVFKGNLVVGDAAPKMKVSETGLYHIVLDLNKNKDLADAQILLCPVTWGVRGGMNGWGFTPLEATAASNDGITYTLTGQSLADGGKFKFAYNSAWKITLDDKGEVKANTNLGEECKPGGADIAVTEGAGNYKITLTFKLAAGDIAKSYSYKVEQESKSEMPKTMNMIGQDFGGWDWGAATVAELVPVWGTQGDFWCTRYFTTNGFKFCAEKAWNGDFTGLGNDSGYTVADGNCFVAEEGFYTVYISLENKVVSITPAEVWGIGDAWGGNAWDYDAADPVKFVADGAVMKATVTNNSGAVRVASKVVAPGADRWFDWWKTEFIWFDGKIAYRGLGDDQERVAVNAGDVITIDFNNGTVEVGEGGPVMPSFAIDGNFDEWAQMPPVIGEGAIKILKMNYGQDLLYFYLECDKNEMIVDNAMAYANKVFFYFINAEGECEKDIWLMINGAPKPTTWGLAGFAGIGVIEGDVIKFEIAFSPEVDPIFQSAGSYYAAAINGQYCDTSSGAEVWGGTTDAVGKAPAEGEAMPYWGVEPELPGIIALDGEFDDWAEIEGVTNDNHTFKVVSDEKYVYCYSHRATTGRYNEIWNGGGYIYVGFDLDDDPETGETLNGKGPYEYVFFISPYGGSADAPAIADDFKTLGYGANCLPADCSCENIVGKGVVTEEGAFLEFRIPRADMPAIPNTPINVYSVGNKDLAMVAVEGITL